MDNIDKGKKQSNAIDPSTLDFRQDVDPNALYELTDLLGEGSYGAVYRARPRIAGKGEEVAIKIIPDADDDLTALWREIRFLQVLRSPFVVSFVESFLYDNELWLVMELCDGGSLYDLKEATKAAFSENELQAIMAFCVLGLAHLHAQMSIHRDVKSGNILLTKDGRAKLGDFGISAELTDSIMKRRTVIGSPYWMAPEVIQETSYDGKADIWSLGITLLELCEGSPPYFSVHPMRAIFMISSKPAPQLKEPEKWSTDMQDFVSKCLIKDSEQRANSSELLKHPWIKSLVREIGSAGNGLPVLENLIDKYWESIERLRSSRFKLPENILENNNGDGGNNGGAEDENSMATMRSGGIPATRQQIRNLSLSKSLNAGSLIRSRSTSAAPRPHSHSGNNNDGTLRTRPRSISYDSDSKYDTNATMVRSNDNNATMIRSNRNQNDFDDYDNGGTLIRNNNGNVNNINSHDYDVSTLKRGGDYHTNSSVNGGSLVVKNNQRNGTLQRISDDSMKENSNAEEMQAALKYFQNEPYVRTDPLPPIPDAKEIAARAERKKSLSKMELPDKDVKPPVPPTSHIPPKIQVGDEKLSFEAEVAILDRLTIGSSSNQDETVEDLKKEIMRQLSALKKQYRQDLETLTNSYEARRKVLKDALLNLSCSSEK